MRIFLSSLTISIYFLTPILALKSFAIGPEITRLKIKFIVWKDVETCIVGQKSETSWDLCHYYPYENQCASVLDWRANYVLATAKLNQFLKAIPVNETAPESDFRFCAGSEVPGWEMKKTLNSIKGFANFISRNTDGALVVEPDIVFLQNRYQLRMSRDWWGGMYFNNQDMDNIIGEQIDQNTDMVIMITKSQSNRFLKGSDTRSLPYLGTKAGGLTFGPWNHEGLRGAPYALVHMEGPYEDNFHAGLVHEFLHGLDFMLEGPSYVSDRYFDRENHRTDEQKVLADRAQVKAGTLKLDPLSYFPMPHHNRDPDWKWAEYDSCYPLDSKGCYGFYQHMLRDHLSKEQIKALRPNHCRNGRMDYGETEIDKGGKPSKFGLTDFCN